MRGFQPTKSPHLDSSSFLTQRGERMLRDDLSFYEAVREVEQASRFEELWAEDRQIYRILRESQDVDVARAKLARYLASLEAVLSSETPGLRPLEVANARECIDVFKSIISIRSERLAKHSALLHLLRMARSPADAGPVSQGFVEEFKHLFRGINGRSGIYASKTEPLFLSFHGAKSSKLRSASLDRIAKQVEDRVARYAHGLGQDAIKTRARNRRRILNVLRATQKDWDNWHWHLRNVVLDAEALERFVRLAPHERKAIRLATANHIPFAITPYYVSLMDESPDGGRDAGVRSQVIPPLDYVRRMIAIRAKGKKSLDFMLERDTSPIELITRRYPMIAVLKPYNSCSQICVYCQRNWEITHVMFKGAKAPPGQIAAAIRWIREHPAIKEVLLTGGDPLVMCDKELLKILTQLAEIDHVERIRIGTRTPVCLPQRITEELVEMLAKFHLPGRRELCVVTHFQYPYEVTPEALQAVQRLRKSGLSVYNQQVYTFYNSRRFESVALRRLLRLIGVDPYYMFNMKGKEETNRYRVPIARILQEIKEEARLVPGLMRTDEPVYNIPKIGKNYLRARQHHRVIMIKANGRRVYEFHPWEKKLAPAGTFVCDDVSIYQYLQRLSEAGEDPEDYATIWYYY